MEEGKEGGGGRNAKVHGVGKREGKTMKNESGGPAGSGILWI